MVERACQSVMLEWQSLKLHVVLMCQNDLEVLTVC